MLGFVGGAAATGTPLLRGRVLPPSELTSTAAAAKAHQCKGDGNASASRGATALAQQALAALGLCSVLAAARRRGPRRSRVILGPRSGCYYEYKFRAKPGDKYKYRFSTDKWTPEFGVWPPECEDRLIKYGELLYKGTPQGPIEYQKKLKSMGGGGVMATAAYLGQERPIQGTLLLDCDGTLVETERDGHRVSFNKAFKEKGFQCEWDVELYGELLTTGGGKERMARYFTDYNRAAWPFEDVPTKDHPAIMELHKLKTKLFMDIVRSGELPLREGIEALLAAASEAGWKLGVCSTSNEDAVRAVVETMLPKYAPNMRIFAGDVVKTKKPDPAIYLLAARELGVAPMKCVVVEDAAIGVKAAKAAGMQVIVTKSIYSAEEDFTGADLVLSSAQGLNFQADVATLLPVLQLQ